MWYVIYARDGKDSLAARQAARPAHLERAHALAAEGRILLAGPMPAIDSPDPGPAGFDGSLMIVQFDELEKAREWVESDPYMTSGAWESVEVKPFLQVLP
jgi:uncharacterized protein YciI